MLEVETRYAALAREMALDIAEGRHPVGSLLPGELELAEQRGVSRATVRAALAQLEELGLISRRKRAGTRVEARRPHIDYAPSLTTLEDLVHYAAETVRQVQDMLAFAAPAATFLTQTGGALGVAILSETGLSFLGFGVPPETPTWGNMLNAARPYFITVPLLAIAPGLTLTIAVLAINFVGDGLRDAFDPRGRRR